MKASVIQRYEYDSLKIGDEGFTEKAFDRLVAFNDKSGNRFFTVGNRRILFQQFVGVLQVGQLTIEVLPKLDRELEDKGLMQRLLLRMLRHTGNLPLEQSSDASLNSVPGSLFELYLRLFLQVVREIVFRGIPKKYSRTRGNERFFKGRLLAQQQLIRNQFHQERFFVEYQHYSIDHQLNQILKKALRIVSGLPYLLSEDARILLDSFESVSDREFLPADFSRIRYTRNTECYRSAVTLAELIISNYQPDLRHGGMDIIAMLFDMNKLFERYVACEMKRYARMQDLPLTIRTQLSRRFWTDAKSLTGKTIRPDIVATFTDSDSSEDSTDPPKPRTFILDTKWKLLGESLDADGDLKQLYAYSLQFDAEKVFLVYPSSDDSFEERDGFFSKSTLHAVRSIARWKIPLIVNHHLNEELGRQMVEKLRGCSTAEGGTVIYKKIRNG